jgi:hypothetical protein
VERYNSSVFALALSCITFPVIFLFVVFELLIRYKGILFLFNEFQGKFPLAPVVMVVMFVFLAMIFIPFRYIDIHKKFAIKRAAIIKMKQVDRYYSVAFVAFCGLLTLLTIGITVGFAIINTPP